MEEEHGETNDQNEDNEHDEEEYNQLGGLCCPLIPCGKPVSKLFGTKSYFQELQGIEEDDDDTQDLAKFEECGKDEDVLNTAKAQNTKKALNTGEPLNTMKPVNATKSLVKLKVMADSGAADCVLPRNLFPEIPMCTTGPKVGMKYSAANGKPIINEGVETLVGKTREGHNKRIDFEIADVNKPLAGLRKIVAKGHRVVLDDAEGQGGYIENKATKQRTGIYMENEVYKFDLYVDVGASAVFGRQGAY